MLLIQLAYNRAPKKNETLQREERLKRSYVMKKKKEALDLYLTIKTTRITCVCECVYHHHLWDLRYSN